MVQRTCLYGECEDRSEVDGDYCQNHQFHEPLRMAFADPFFRPGIQNTIRVGTKWFESIAIGEQFKAHEPDSEKDIAVFEVVGLMKCLIEEIPNEILELNHDRRCNRLPGLIKIMKECYTDVNLKTEVTVVLFRYIETCE